MIREWFSLDGVRCDALGVEMLGYTAQALPEQERYATQIPGMDGQYERLTGAYKPRVFTVRCALLSDDEFDLAAKLHRLRAWLSGKKELMLWDRAGITYDAVLSNAPNLDNQVLWGAFELGFSCAPAGRGPERVVAFGVPFACLGNANSPCVLRVTLNTTVNGATIYHAKGKALITGSIPAGQALEIDALKRYVTLNGLNIMPRVDVSIDWPVVIPGPNTITASVAASGTVRFAERWI